MRPAIELERTESHEAPARLEGEDIVCLYGEPWDTPLRTSKHHLMEHLCRRNRVLYVEMPLHPLEAVRRPGEFLAAVRTSVSRLRRVGENLHVWRGVVPLPYHAALRGLARPLVNHINQTIMTPQLRRAMAELGFDTPIFWFCFATPQPLLRRFRTRVSVLHLIDEWLGLSGVPASCAVFERRLMEEVDLVVATSQVLVEKARPFNDNVHLVRHGVDYDLFAHVPASPPPPELVSLKRPLVGYFGALHKLDAGLISELAAARPDWNFVLIGPTGGTQGGDVRWADAHDNIHLLGARPHRDLPRYLHHFDAVYFPFQLNRLTRAMTPIKVYECMAAGVPVVTRPVPELRSLGHLYFADDVDDFVRELGRAFEEASGPAEERRRFARDCTWESRFRRIEELTLDAMGQRE